MKRITSIMLVMIACLCAMQLSAQPQKGPSRSDIFNTLPAGFTQLGTTSLYYSIQPRTAVGPGEQTGISILGEIGGRYYSSTYEYKSPFGWLANGPGAGFIAAFRVDNYEATYVDAANGTTSHGVNFTARLEPQGDVAGRIIYTLTNTNNQAVTINAGVWGDIMIGDNDRAPLERLRNNQETVYGIKMKHSTAQNSPLLCMLFGEGVTGVVTPADDYWFGVYLNNYSASAITGNYSTNIDYYMVENSNAYDCGLGFCWKNRVIEPGQSIELSYVISVGEIPYEEPFVPGEDRFEYQVEAFDFPGWNDLSVAHPAHVWGYYEHPYGQSGYIEYQVDDENTWHRIPTELVSGENFDLSFDMMFNQARTTDHVLNLRFNDGLDNIVPMDGLAWTDVRSIPITGLEDREYNGQPQTYEVTIGDGEPFTIGLDGEYVNPGTYSFGFEGDFNENTIGIHNEEFAITAGETVILVEIPEDCVYDGNEHAAFAMMIVGDGQIVLTYVDEEGNILTEAPVEPGTYEVFVEVTGSQNYNDIENTSHGTFTIDKAQSVIDYTIPESSRYDGKPRNATVTLVEGDGEVTVTYVNVETGAVLTQGPTEIGTYNVVVTVTETAHYYGIDEAVIGTFSILSRPTSIDEINAEGVDNGPWYTIDGKRIAAPTQRGIYIHNGQKYYVK